MKVNRFFSFAYFFSFLYLVACGNDSASNANNENGDSSLPPQQGTEIPCDAGNEGLVIKPVDSENSRLCTNGSWVEIFSSSSSDVLKSSSSTILSSSSSVIQSEVEGSSSSSEISGQTGNDVQSSSSSTILSSSSSVISSSSSAPTEDPSSSSEESKMYLCDDGVTYVLDLANCANSSSSSVIQSSSSTKKPEESSSSVMSSSSSTPISSSSSTPKLSSSSTPIEDPCSSSSSVVSSSSTSISSSSVQSSSSLVLLSSSSSVGIPSKLYDCSEYQCITTIYLNPNIEYGEYLDDRPYQNKVYRTVKIGEQEWFAQNLNYNTEGSRCPLGRDSLCNLYGRLYKWEKAINACPPQWRLPNADDYQKLSAYVEENNNGFPVGESLKYGKNNIWGFSGLLAGFRTRIGVDSEYGRYGYFWTSTENGEDKAKGRLLIEDRGILGYVTEYKEAMQSVRCIKD